MGCPSFTSPMNIEPPHLVKNLIVVAHRIGFEFISIFGLFAILCG